MFQNYENARNFKLYIPKLQLTGIFINALYLRKARNSANRLDCFLHHLILQCTILNLNQGFYVTDDIIRCEAFIFYLASLSSIPYGIQSNISDSLSSIHRADTSSGLPTVNVHHLTALTCHSPTFLINGTKCSYK